MNSEEGEIHASKRQESALSLLAHNRGSGPAQQLCRVGMA